jgi:RNA polymerase sigma-70 factor (ECF subfamily)
VSCTAGDRFGDEVAVYLLGALPAEEQRPFEQHLRECTYCAGEVDRLRPVVDLLAGIDESDLVDSADSVDLADPAAPDAVAGGADPLPDLLPGLLARAAAERRKRRRVVAGLGSVAAAALIALAVVLGTRPGTGSQPQPLAGRPMVAVGANTPLRATAAVTSKAWGTQIELDCRYLASSGWSGGPVGYELEVVDRSGATHRLGSWTVAPTGATRFTSGTDLPANQIRLVRIDLPGGTPILQLTR